MHACPFAIILLEERRNELLSEKGNLRGCGVVFAWNPSGDLWARETAGLSLLI